MYCQMIRVISSPSSSTTGLVTLIFAMTEGPFWKTARLPRRWVIIVRAIALPNRLAKADALAHFQPIF